MAHDNSKGEKTVPLMLVIGAIAAWCSGLSIAAYNVNGTVSSLTAAVGDIKNDTEAIPDLKAKVDWLATINGYRPSKESTTTASAIR